MSEVQPHVNGATDGIAESGELESDPLLDEQHKKPLCLEYREEAVR
jgi:hypothetical protein